MRRALLALVLLGCGSSPSPTPQLAPPPPPAAVREVPVARRDPATLERDCARRDLPACGELAERHANGRGVDLDRERAAELRARACDQQHARSCAALAAQYAYAHGVGADEPKARQYFTRGCDLGDAWSCEGLAQLETGSRRDALYAQAFALYMRQCDDGNAVSCFGASALFGNRRVTTDVPAAAWQASRTRADARCHDDGDDDNDSCWASWRMHDVGLGGPASPAAAARAARRGCDRKQPTMCSILARAHEQGRGVSKDDSRARALHIRACKLGDPYACYFAANREPDPQRQLALRRRACDAGNLGECATVIEALDNAEPHTARMLRERSCRRGWTDACVELGDALVAARRVADAMPWYERACRDDQTTTGCVRIASLRREACDRGDTAACQELDADLAKLPTARRVAVMHACCPQRPELAALPGGALLLFFDALGAKDLAAVKQFVHPRHGLHVRLGWHDDTGASEERLHFRVNARTLGKLAEVSRPAADSLTCDEAGADGRIRCRAFGGGYGASFQLFAAGGRLYVVDIDEESH